MKAIIFGSRDYTDKTEFLKIMDYIQTLIEHYQMESITEIISGHAKERIYQQKNNKNI